MSTTSTNSPSQEPSGSWPAELSRFTSLVEAALAAFACDVSYAVALASAAGQIRDKQQAVAALPGQSRRSRSYRIESAVTPLVAMRRVAS